MSKFDKLGTTGVSLGLVGNVGSRGQKGTRITQGIVDKARADQAGILEIRQDNTEAIINAIEQQLVKGLEECGLLAERYAVDNITRNKSVDTGRLRASITHQIDEAERAVYVGTNVEYARYVELGTERAKAKPYLVPAVRDHNEEYRRVMSDAMKN